MLTPYQAVEKIRLLVHGTEWPRNTVQFEVRLRQISEVLTQVGPYRDDES